MMDLVDTWLQTHGKEKALEELWHVTRGKVRKHRQLADGITTGSGSSSPCTLRHRGP